MPLNPYFTQGVLAEQNLYENLIIESLKIYGNETLYIPREIVNRDRILQDDSTSRFDNAYPLEMYIESIDGFDGDGDLFSKFGVEIRDAATFIVSRLRWNEAVVANEEATEFFRPREGDLIFLTLSQTFFEITRVETERPFYQLKDLPTFKLRVEMFEYNDEDFDTGIVSIDSIETNHSYQTIMSMPVGAYTFVHNEEVQQDNTSFTMIGEVTDFNDSDGLLYVSHSGNTTSEYHEWTTTGLVVGQVNASSFIPSSINENLQEESQNVDFDEIGDGFIDFSEDNPFGDPQ